ncbi:recombinase family protein [Escherichia coli]|uniref:recombinase family protein n=1 Tax=Escherichia coli TaxID=562 RepID=UPI000DA514EB|nr:recombinase family protein [Escherichia coli]SRB35081.1 Uncharacterised protein [Escherichia coli]SVF91005.1 Uncharacterised protein [Escherichia coli]
MIIGYARKSTHLQDVTHQVDELTKAGCEQIYHEQISRGGTKRGLTLSGTKTHVKGFWS